ncbi:MAG: hypothetical protein ABEJ93_04865 [Candidatus Nanohalobium sp.]
MPDQSRDRKGLKKKLLIAAAITLTVGAAAAAPQFYDTEGLDGSHIRQSNAESFLYNFTINSTTGEVKKTSVKASVNYSGGFHTFEWKPGTDTVSLDSNDEDLWIIDPNNTWSDYGLSSPVAGDVLKFNLSAEDDQGNSASTGDAWVQMTVDGQAPNFYNRTPENNGASNNGQQLISLDIVDLDGSVDWSSVNLTVRNESYAFLNGTGLSDPHVSNTGSNLTINASESPSFDYSNSDKITVDLRINDTVEFGKDHQASTSWSFFMDTTAPHSFNLAKPGSDVSRRMGENLTLDYSYNESHPDVVNFTLADGSGNNATWTLNDRNNAATDTIVDAKHEIDLDQPDYTSGNGLQHGSTYNMEFKLIDRAGNTNNPVPTQDTEISNLDFEKKYYNTSTTAVFRVYSPKANAGTDTIETIKATINNTEGNNEEITLTEMGSDTPKFKGNVTLTQGTTGQDDGELSVEEADTIFGYYSKLSGRGTAKVDGIEPHNFSIFSPTGKAYISNNREADMDFLLDYGFTENGSGVSNISYSIIRESNSLTFNTNSSGTGFLTRLFDFDLNKTTATMPEGTYDLGINVTDNVDLYGSLTATDKVVVDDTPPEGNISFIQGGVKGVNDEWFVDSTNSSRKVNVTLKDNNALPTDPFHLKYHVEGSGTNQSALINLSQTTNSTEVNLTIDDTALQTDRDKNELWFWVNSSDRAGNNWTSTYGDPMTSYTLDKSAPGTTIENVVNDSCGPEIEVKSADTRGVGIDKFIFYADGNKIDTLDKKISKGYQFTQRLPLKDGTYTVNVSTVDALGNKANTTVDVKSLLGAIELDVTTDFHSVYESSGTLYSNRSMDVLVSDTCSFPGSPEGNRISGTNLEFEFNATDGDSLANLTNSQDTTGSNGVGEANITSIVGAEPISANLTANTTVNGQQISTEVAFKLEEKKVELEKGWNYFSTPLIPEEQSPEKVLEGIKGTDIDVIWGYNAENNTWNSYDPDKPNNSLDTIKPGKGYILKAKGSGTLTLTGTLVDAKDPDNIEDLAPNDITLYKGWNLVGFRRWMNASAYLNEFGISTHYSIQDIYGGVTTIQTTETKEGEAYWVKMNSTESVTAADVRAVQ